jgi:energy-coupling factor transporter ATP-binding protein EcfA2
MDEPDAYLSSQGQQDLLRILEEFALPEDRSRHDQVIYVTHSPYLINRNAAERIRVLDKGVTDEGTRVVKDVARNHYEPLRSSLGAFVAETSFIGGSNLFVEGLADQVLLAGISSHLQAQGAAKMDTLDLNTVTIVPAGSASSVPYLVYLARGRDVIRPPCVALLDSDDSGDEAVKALTRGGPRRQEILPSKFIVQVGKWAAKAAQHLSITDDVIVTELEDLISLPVAVMAARSYAVKVVEIPRDHAETLVEADIAAKLKEKPGSLFDSLKAAFAERLGPDVHIEKVGFVKEVVAALAASRNMTAPPPGFREVERNVGLILAELAKQLRRANQQEHDRRLNNRLKRTVAGFLSDYPAPTTRERGRLLIEEVQASIEDSEEGDRVRLLTERLRRDFELDENLTDPIDCFDDFRERVGALQYEERFFKQNMKVVVTETSAAPSSADAELLAQEAASLDD